MDNLAGTNFARAVAQCQGNLSLSLFSTWTILASTAIFVISAIPESICLLRKPVIVRAPKALLIAKLSLGTALVALNITLLALSLAEDRFGSTCNRVYESLNVVGSSFSLGLSLISHFKSQRPSIFLCSFLFVTFLCNVGKSQDLWLSVHDVYEKKYAASFTALIVAQVVFLATNSTWRMGWLGWKADTHSPEETSSIFSLGLYSWVNRLLWMGYRKVLSIEDLYPLDQAISAKLPDSSSGPELVLKPTPSNLAILAWAAKPMVAHLLLPVIPRLFLIGFTFCQPFFIQRLLEFLAEGGAPTSPTAASGLVGAAVLIYTGIAVSTALYWYYQERAQSILRAFLVTSIYQKTTESMAGSDMAAVTLMSSDVDRIYTGMRFMHELWANVIQIALSAWFVYRELGLAFLAPLVLVAFSFASSFILSKFASKYQRSWMQIIQKRVEITGKVLSHIKEYRISGLTSPVEHIVQQERVGEINVGAISRLITGISATLSQVPEAVAPVVAFALGPHVIDSTKAFTALSCLSLMTSPLMMALQSIPIMAASFACLQRIYEFVTAPPRIEYRLSSSSIIEDDAKPENSDKTSLAAVKISRGQFGWSESSPVLENISLTLTRSSLTIITGPVASGKSTLCKAILGEIPHSKGEVMVDVDATRIAFCDQTPFLMNASILDNIIGFSPFDDVRYRDVVDATALQDDFNSLRHGDQTRIGSKGMSLSGGQKQRVSLARTLYHDADLLVLDDIFTGLDSSTQEIVCERVFSSHGLLRRRKTTAILCTQAARFVSMADQVVELAKGGTILKQYLNDAVDRAQGDHDATDVSVVRRRAHQDASSDKDTSKSAQLGGKGSTTGGPVTGQAAPAAATDRSTYLHYLSSIGFAPLVAYAIMIACLGFLQNFPTVWVRIWSADSVEARPAHSFAFYIGIYALLAGLCLAIELPAGLMVLRMFVRLSGTNLHQQTLAAAMHSSLRFLTTTDTGTILNLFSQDMTIIDSQLPRWINNLSITSAIAVGQAVVIATSSKYMAISYPFFIAILYGVQRFYLPTSKQLRILDLEAKSPLYTHFLDTLNGITTIRAFGWFPSHVSRNKVLLDTSQRPSYLLAMAQQWLLLTMNMVVAVLGTILAAIATQIQGVDSGSIGVGMVMLISFSTVLTILINSYTGLEVSLGGVSRLKAFSQNTEREDKLGEDVDAGAEWPVRGKVVVREVSASYTDDPLEAVLSDLSLTIEPRQKVAICGRTGSGKSSLVALLLRMLDPLNAHDGSSPSILIDEVPLRTLDRTTLRERVMAVSQDAIFLPDGSTFRQNLDPWDAASAEEVTSAIDSVGLLSTVSERGGTEAVMDAAHLSAGQKQLLALGRAVVRRRVRARTLKSKGLEEGGLLLLDEVTASVDAETERKMMELVRSEFEAYTVIMVTHSARTAAGFDRVITMDKGRIVGDGPPGMVAE